MQDPPIPADLRQWIVNAAGAGHTVEYMQEQLVSIGVAQTAASTMLHSVLASMPSLSVNVPVPDLGVASSPTQLAAGDRNVRVLAKMRNPTIVSLGGLLSDSECAELMKLAKPRLARSPTVNNETGGQVIHASRTSDGMFFQRGEMPLITRIERRIARLTNWPIENGEGLQVLRYGPGAQYEPHYDYFIPDAAGTPLILKRGGQRVASLIMYLNTPTEGGGTVFPDVDFEVTPQRGNAVFFSYPRAHPSTATLHGGAPVTAGEKWIATKWLREREFV